MAEAITISTSDYIKSIIVKIDKRTYRVRKVGAGEGLDISSYYQESQRIQSEATVLQAKYEESTDEEEKQELLNQLLDKMKPIAEIRHKIEEIYIGLFDDGEGGKYSRQLVKTIGLEKVQEIYKDIMRKMDEKDNDKSA